MVQRHRFVPNARFAAKRDAASESAAEHLRRELKMDGGVVEWPKKMRELKTALVDSTRWNAFEYRDSDVVIATWAKSGTTWMQQIVAQLVWGAPEGLAVVLKSPWLEMRAAPLDAVLAQLRAQTHRRIVKTHLPVDALVFSPHAKYIYVGRDARDVVWSAYNHHSALTREAIDATNNTPGLVGPPLQPVTCDVRTYYLRFLESAGLPGFPLESFWENVQGWWNIRHLPNVLLVHYNEPKADISAAIRRIARFLGIEIDEAIWPSIIEHCSFDYMRSASTKIDVLSYFLDGGGKILINKGTNGRWRDVLTMDEIDRCDDIAARNLTPDCAQWLKTGSLP